MKTQSTHAKCAAAIRTELYKSYPNVRFSVTSKSFSMGDSVHIDWYDGPTYNEVKEIADKYQYGSFDGMTDMYEYTNKRDDIPQTKYVQTQRSMRPQTRELLMPFAEDIYNKNDFSECNEAGNLLYRIFAQTSLPGNAEITGIEPIPGVTSGVYIHDLYRITFNVPEVVEKTEPEAQADGIQIINYSDLSIAVIGDTKPIKDQLKALGGKFNFRLRCGAGWIFAKTKEEKVRAALKIA